MLSEARALYKLGFNIHWLKKGSKAPVESGWSNKKKSLFKSLKTNYKPGLNLGVVLGTHSKIKNSYLAVIDCDVKGKGIKFEKELNEKLKELQVTGAPTVMSGRGNGSRHIYIRTKTPLKPKHFFKSKELVKVHMPSAPNPSKRDKKMLSVTELKDGYRIRPAWEISLMGKGQQVVLPPSIHPDTKKPYTWAKEIKTVDDVPLVNLSKFYKDDNVIDTVIDIGKIKREFISLEKFDIPKELKEKIETGVGVEDRSAALMSVTMALMNRDISIEDILNILTNPKFYLGQAAYAHTQSSSRKLATKWLLKYTIPKARAKVNFEDAFSDEVVIEALSTEEKEKQKELMLKDQNELTDWKMTLKRNQSDGYPKVIHYNIKKILNNSNGQPCAARNTFSFDDIWLCDTLWGSRKGQMVTDDDITRIKDYLSQGYSMDVSREKINDALSAIALENEFHPVREYLSGLEWDGTERLKTWLQDYMSAEGHPSVLRAFGERTLVGMCMRIFEPGCKHDSVLIFEGKQDAGKSSTARILAGEDWFSDSEINIGDKDAVVSMAGNWILELGELSVLSKRDSEELKQFISRSIDKIRPHYGKRLMSYPRQSIFMGTTNKYEYLKDKTGNRRYWPVKTGRIHLNKLRQDRDQLLAEAMFLYTTGVPNYIDKWAEPKLYRLVQNTQQSRVVEDVLEEALEEYLNSDACEFKDKPFTLNDLMADSFSNLNIKNDMANQHRVGTLLRTMGYEKVVTRSGKKVKKMWVKKVVTGNRKKCYPSR